MHDFSRVLRQRHPAVPMLLGDQREHLRELGQGRLARVHQRVAAAEGRDLGHPGSIVLPVEYDLVVVKAHGSIIRLAWRWSPFKPYADRAMTMPYYNVPIVVLEDAVMLGEWAARAVAVARTAKTAKPGKARRRAKATKPAKTKKEVPR